MIQIRLRARGATWRGMKLDRRKYRELIETWIQTGAKPRGVRITATLWGSGLTSEQVRCHMRETGRRQAESCPGMVRYYHAPYMTLCDYDWVGAPPLPGIWALAAQLGIKPSVIEYHRTARGWHLAVAWDRDLKPGETVALQLLLGSDPGREAFNLARLLAGARGKRWNLLFDRKI